MLTKIREKAQGAFAWGILIIITVPFALWGIESYISTGKETPVASVGSKDFFQQDINKAYEQYSQNFQGMKIDEQILKAESLKKLIQDEVLLQYVRSEGLTASDETTRDFIKALPYFQVDGQFSESQYRSLLNSQHMSSSDFVGRIKNALIMDQFQRAILDSSFATSHDVESFFKIQNQQRDVEYITVPLPKIAEQPAETEILAYYEQHKDLYKIPEQVSVDYLELALENIAKTVEVNEEKLKSYYEEQKASYTTAERRKISHILFAVDNKTDDKTALANAEQAKKDLAQQDFAAIAREKSDDKLSAKSGGDLGLLQPGVMEKPFEEAAGALKFGEVSNPVRSGFGYHLIKLTELVPGEIKSFESVKAELTKAYQKAQAENLFYEAGETLTQTSYENPESLQSASDALGLPINHSTLFNRESGEGIASDPKIRGAAFSDEVLHGNNSSPVELSGERIIVLHVHEHKEASTKAFEEVKPQVVTALLKDKAQQLADGKVQQIKQRLLAGETIKVVADDLKLEMNKLSGLTRKNPGLPLQLVDMLFKVAKPVGDKPTIFATEPVFDQRLVVSLLKVNEGSMGEEDKKQMIAVQKSMANAFGQIELSALMKSLEAEAEVKVNLKN
ncbi:MAG: SurA N-terminal domain-containing protein [Methylococcaceae bacterium]|jgi:peptidyl-prolyl cis-trans isomerase D